MMFVQVVISDEEIERDIVKAYRPLSSQDGVESWTIVGPYSVVFRRLLGQREVWVETPVYHFSNTANAWAIDKAQKDQSYYLADLGGPRWVFMWRSKAPVVRFGNTTKARETGLPCIIRVVLSVRCVQRQGNPLAWSLLILVCKLVRFLPSGLRRRWCC